MVDVADVRCAWSTWVVVDIDVGDVASASSSLLLTWLGVVVVDDLGGVAVVIDDVGAWRGSWLSTTSWCGGEQVAIVMDVV